MSTRSGTVTAILIGMMMTGSSARAEVAHANPALVQKVTAALPSAATAKPAWFKSRTILVINKCNGFKHSVIPLTAKAIELLGIRTGAYKTVCSDDLNQLNPKNLSNYDAVVLNSTTKLDVNEAQKKALLAFVNEGKGLVGIHAAADNFDNWPEGIAMIGGLFDGHPWGAGGTWTYKLDDPSHVLNQSFNGKGFKFSDEIYQFKVDKHNTAANLRFLVSLDMSDPTTASHNGNKGKDGHYAISWIKNQGKGRVFYCSFGHNESVVCNPAILKHYLDGIQFAIGDLKADATPTAYVNLATYDFDKSKHDLTLIRDAISAAGAGEKLAIEQRLLSVLANPQATFAAKSFTCRCLVLIGTEASVPALSGLLVDKNLSHMARMAIEHIPGNMADKALVAAMKQARGDIKAGIIATIGARKTTTAVYTLADQLTDKDETVVRAALAALASIGNTSSAKRLMKAEKQIPPVLKGAWADACLTTADTLLKSGKVMPAAAIYTHVYANEALPAATRAGALRGIAEATGGQSGNIIFAAMKSKEPIIKSMAARSIKNANSTDLARKVLLAFKDFDTDVQAIVLGCVAEMPGTVSTSDIMPLCDNPDPAVAASAYRIIGNIGRAADVPVLVARLAADPDKNTGALTALAALEVKDADEAIIKELQKADPKVQAELVKVLAQRNSTQSVRALIPFIGSPDASVSREAIKAIIAMGDTGTIDDLAGLILTSDKSQQIIGAMVSIARRTESQAKVMTALKETWGKADAAKKVAILSVLPTVGGADALGLIKSALAGNDETVYDAAVRALCDWKDSSPIDDLFGLASAAKTDTQKILSLRSFIRMIDTAKDDGKRFTRYSEAMKLAGRDDEKKLVITGLGGVTTLDSYKIVSACLDNAGLSSEAQIASLKIAQSLKDSHPAEVIAGMKKILAAPVNDWAKDEAAKILKAAESKLPPSQK